MHVVVDVQCTGVARVVPSLKVVPAVPTANPVPVTVTLVAPAVEPELGLRAVIVGGPYVTTVWPPVALVPPGVVKVTATVPAVPGGATAVTETLPMLTSLALTEPKRTLSALSHATNEKPLPKIVTVVPPAAGPVAGLTLWTTGWANDGT